MRLENFSGGRSGRLAALLAAAIGLSLSVHAGSHGEKIQFSDPNTPITTTSNLTATTAPGLNRLNPEPNALKQVQEDLFRPLANSMSAVNSMQGVTTLPNPPQQPRAAPSKRTKEYMDRRRNWAFTDLNDLYPDPTLEEALGVKEAGTEANDKNPASVMEKYFNNLGQKGGTNRMPGPDAMEAAGFNPYSTTNGGLNLTARPFANDAAKSLFTSSVSDDSAPDVAPGFKSPFYNPVSANESQAAQKRTEQFRHLLEHNQATPTGTASVPGLDPSAVRTSTPANNNYNPFNQSAAPYRSSINPNLGFTDPTVTALHNSALDDPTAKSLGMPNPKPPAPAVRPDPIEASQRMLDPFGSAVVKRKF